MRKSRGCLDLKISPHIDFKISPHFIMSRFLVGFSTSCVHMLCIHAYAYLLTHDLLDPTNKLLVVKCTKFINERKED